MLKLVAVLLVTFAVTGCQKDQVAEKQVKPKATQQASQEASDKEGDEALKKVYGNLQSSRVK